MSSTPTPAGSRCAFHRDRPRAFTCRKCRRPFCAECQAMSAENVCLRCEISGSLEGAVADEVAVPRVAIGTQGRRAGPRVLIGVLVALNVAGGIGWFVARPAPGPELETAFEAVDVVTRAVEARRDASGKVPATLDSLPLPSEVTALVRSGAIRYIPSADRSRFSITYVANPESGAPEPTEDDRSS